LLCHNLQKHFFQEQKQWKFSASPEFLMTVYMKTLADHTIIYDDECPMCDLYSCAFTKTGMLDEDGRQPFSHADPRVFKNIDSVRACNEIALVNNKTGAVLYGIDSLMSVIGNSMPFFNPLFRLGWFRWIMKRFYSFISYNRKIIVPGRNPENKNKCTPSFNLKYRIAYIIFTWLVTSLILNIYSKHLDGMLPPGNFFREFMICGGQILFQGSVLFILKRQKMIHYLGNMMTISFGGAAVLLIGLCFSGFIESPIFFTACFIITAGLMFLEHMRRVKLLDLHWSISATWVFYRLIVLFIIV
jgi:hypothetical protein